MQGLDWKKIVGALGGLVLAGLLGYAAKSGIEIPCPAAPQPTAVISAPAAK